MQRLKMSLVDETTVSTFQLIRIVIDILYKDKLYWIYY